MSKLRIHAYYNYEHPKGDYVLAHEHQTFECVFYATGSGKLGVAGEIKNYRAPCLAITPPHVIHDEAADEFSRVYVCLFSPEDPAMIKGPCLYSLSPSDGQKIQGYFDEMLREQKKKLAYSEDVCASLLRQAYFYTLRYAGSPLSKKNPLQVVEQAKNYLKENYSSPIDFARIAESYGYSYSRFRHLFTAEVGVSPNQYLLNQRLEVAKRLLQSVDDSVKSISQRIGFSSNVYFTNFFKARVGVTPETFRLLAKEGSRQGVARLAKEEP